VPRRPDPPGTPTGNRPVNVPRGVTELRRAALAMLAALAVTAAAPARGASAHAVGAPTRAQAWIARLVAPTPIWRTAAPRRPLATISAQGPWTGGTVGLLVVKTKRDTIGRRWLRVVLPERPNGRTGWLTADRVVLTRTPWRVEIDRSARTIALLRAGRTVLRARAVVGAPATPTPLGRFAIYEKARQADPHGFLGPWALHLTGHSDVLEDYGGGPGRIAIHGRDATSLQDPLGSARSHGCVRIADAAVTRLARTLAPGTPVTIRR
jgi:lipoprotein-anchoring transpeptidase ErfK/SrfK